LEIFNSSYAIYEEIEILENEAKILTQFIINLNIKSEEKQRNYAKIIALIVVLCSLSFLGYFVYSLISCYSKKPRLDHKKFEEIPTNDRTEINMQNV